MVFVRVNPFYATGLFQYPLKASENICDRWHVVSLTSSSTKVIVSYGNGMPAEKILKAGGIASCLIIHLFVEIY